MNPDHPALRRGKSCAPLILALTGKPDVGKDTVAQILAPSYGFRSIAFADALRTEIAEAWRIDSRLLTDRVTKEWPIPALAAGMCNSPAFMRWVADGDESLTEPRSPRWVMQTWASFQRRTTPDYYARIVERWLQRQIGSGWNRLVVSDLRDPIEEAMLRRIGAKLVRIHRPDATPLQGGTARHVSEQHHRITADADIVNDSSLQALAEAALLCVVQLQGTGVQHA